MVLVQTLDNGKQALFPAHSRKVIRLKPFQYRLTSATTQQVDDILIQLHFALFHVIEQDCLVLAVFVERNASASTSVPEERIAPTINAAT